MCLHKFSSFTVVGRRRYLVSRHMLLRRRLNATATTTKHSPAAPTNSRVGGFSWGSKKASASPSLASEAAQGMLSVGGTTNGPSP